MAERLILVECVGAVSESWFGAAPRGARWYVIGGDGVVRAGPAEGDMHGIAPDYDIGGRIGAAFGRHAVDSTHIVREIVPPEGAHADLIDGYRPAVVAPLADGWERRTYVATAHPEVTIARPGGRDVAILLDWPAPAHGAGMPDYLAACAAAGMEPDPLRVRGDFPRGGSAAEQMQWLRQYRSRRQ